MRRLDDEAPAALLSVRLPPSMLKALRKRARKGLSLSEVVRQLLDSALDEEATTPQARLRRIEREARALRRDIGGKR